jgi:hypothetical protein
LSGQQVAHWCRMLSFRNFWTGPHQADQTRFCWRPCSF